MTLSLPHTLNSGHAHKTPFGNEPDGATIVHSSPPQEQCGPLSSRDAPRFNLSTWV